MIYIDKRISIIKSNFIGILVLIKYIRNCHDMEEVICLRFDQVFLYFTTQVWLFSVNTIDQILQLTDYCLILLELKLVERLLELTLGTI